MLGEGLKGQMLREVRSGEWGMDVEVARRLRERRAHQKAQIANRWQERVMRELKRREDNRKNQEEAPQRMGMMDTQAETVEREATTV